MTTKSRRGRPSRAEAMARSLQGLDVENCDPVLVLKLIACSDAAPAAARVSACRQLLQLQAVDVTAYLEKPVTGQERAAQSINDRAVAAMNGRRPN
jgi:hypothetical protein